ncbi:MAG: S16 family serine protease, partial [Myxococcota bacterium]
MRALTAYLEPGAIVGVSVRQYLRRAMRTPWCFPAGESPVPALDPGTALLVSVGDDRRSVWSFHRRDEKTGPCAALGEGAREALRTAERIVTHDLPVVLNAGAVNGSTWAAEHLWTEGPGFDPTIDGPSFGLAMLLAVASEALEMPLPGDLATSAEIAPDGKLLPVGSIREKVGALVANVPGVRRLIVCEGQTQEADDAKPPGSALEIVPAGNVATAFDTAFASVDEVMRRRFAVGNTAQRYASQLFFLTLVGAPLLHWAGVKHAADLLLGTPGLDEVARGQARWARKIAARHCGARGEPLPWPDDTGLRALA